MHIAIVKTTPKGSNYDVVLYHQGEYARPVGIISIEELRHLVKEAEEGIKIFEACSKTSN